MEQFGIGGDTGSVLNAAARAFSSPDGHSVRNSATVAMASASACGLRGGTSLVAASIEDFRRTMLTIGGYDWRPAAHGFHKHIAKTFGIGTEHEGRCLPEVWQRVS